MHDADTCLGVLQDGALSVCPAARQHDILVGWGDVQYVTRFQDPRGSYILY